MLHTPHSLSNTYSSASQPPLTSPDAAPFKSAATIHLNTASTIYAAIEFLVVASITYCIGFFYHGIFLNTWFQELKYIFAAIFIAILILLISLGFHNFVAIRRQSRNMFLWKGAGTTALAFSIFLTVIFVTKHSEEYSRITFILQIFGVGFAVVSMRLLFYLWLQAAFTANRIKARRVALIGDDFHCSMFAKRLEITGIQTAGSFRLPEHCHLKDGTVINRTIHNLIADIRTLRIDDVIVLANNKFMVRVFDLSSSLAELPAGIHVIPVEALNIFASSKIAEFGSLQTIQVYRPPLSRFDLSIKRAFDVISVTIGLIVLSPLFLVTSIAIKLDTRGPIFFRQTRHGFNNEEIRVFKFRSMTSMEDGGKFIQALKNDPRVTRVGRIIRRTNIDELPQLINVLRGEMSIVGPRPHATAHNNLFKDMIAPFSRRHNVKPGITGWAQVSGFRGATDTFEKMQQRIEYDLQYVDNWSFLFDMKIILMTLFSKRAYLNAY